MLTARRPSLPLAVVVHPRTVADVARRFGWTRYIPPRLAEKALPLLPPFTVTSTTISVGDRQTEVAFIACTATSEQIRSGRVSLAPKLDTCLHMAIEHGASLVALSGYLGTHKGPGPAWTAGEDGKLLLAFWALRAIARMAGTPLATTRAAVLAATDPDGAVMAHLLAREAGELVLVDRPGPKLDRLAEEILDATGTAAILMPNLQAGAGRLWVAGGRRAAEFLSEASAAMGERISQAAILDLGRPPFLSDFQSGAFVFHGGAARFPDGISLPEELGFPAHTACGAITEGIMLALAGERPRRKDGLPTLAGCDRLAALAKRYDIEFGALMRDNDILPWRAVQANLPRAVDDIAG